MKYLLLLFILVSCNKKPEITELNLSPSQRQFYNQASLEFKAYLDSCMNRNYSYAYCYTEFKEISKEKITTQGGGASIGDIAIGTAIGGVATKVITGK